MSALFQAPGPDPQAGMAPWAGVDALPQDAQPQDAQPQDSRPRDSWPQEGALRIRPLSLLGAFLRRDWGIAWSYRLPFALALFQSFISLGLVFFLGRLVGHDIAPGAGGGSPIPYFAFAVMGTLLLTVLNVSLTAVAFQLRSDQTTGTLEILFTMPPPPWMSVLASASYRVVYASVSAFLTLMVAVAFFGLRFHTSPLGFLLSVGDLLATIVVFCSAGLVFAAFVVVFKRGEMITGLAATALSILGGVYYPVSLLPTPLRDLANVLPFTWALEVLRGGLLGHRLPVAPFVELCIFALVALPAAIAIFDRALDHARRHATLAQY
ncbi:MAG: ABC transporter permease [Acidimicrobiales bacterium]